MKPKLKSLMPKLQKGTYLLEIKELEWNDYKGNLSTECLRNRTYKRLSRLEAAGRLTKEVRDGNAYWGLPE